MRMPCGSGTSGFASAVGTVGTTEGEAGVVPSTPKSLASSEKGESALSRRFLRGGVEGNEGLAGTSDTTSSLGSSFEGVSTWGRRSTRPSSGGWLSSSRVSERVRRADVGGGLVGRRGRRPGRGGEGGGDGVRLRLSSSVGIVAAFSREIDTFSGLPPGMAIR